MKKIWSWIIIKNKRTLLIKRKFSKKDNPNLWALPGWKNENNETMVETSVREVIEEVWLNFSNLELFHENKTANHHFFRYIWDATWNLKIQESECDWYWWFTYNEILNIPISENMLELTEKLHHKNLI